MRFELLPCFISLKAFVVKLILYLRYLLMDTPSLHYISLVQYCELFHSQPLSFI